MDIRQTAKAIRETMEAMPDRDVYVVSVDNWDKGTTAGCIVQMSRATAARGLVERTHRLATPEEIEVHLVDQKAKGDAIRQADLESRFPLNLNVYTQGKEAIAERTPAPAPKSSR
jgi:hypothetical protein